MDIVIDKRSVHSGNYRPKSYRVTTGKDGRTWVYALSMGASAFIHCSADPRENEPGYNGSRGYGGSTLTFKLESGDTITMQGPWHSNSDSLLLDTGIDLTQQWITFVGVALMREYLPDGTCVYKNVLWKDDDPVNGEYNRGDKIAKHLANQLQQDVFLFKETIGGTSNGPVCYDKN